MELIFFLLGLAVLVLMIYMLGALRQIHQTLGESNQILNEFRKHRKNQTPTDRVPEVPPETALLVTPPPATPRRHPTATPIPTPNTTPEPPPVRGFVLPPKVTASALAAAISSETHCQNLKKTPVGDAVAPTPYKKCMPLPPAPPKVRITPERQRSEFEMRALELWRKLWCWLVVGEEFRPQNVAAEYSIATAWLVRGAFALILFGIAFFIKYSHDTGLIPPEWRMVIAATVGVAMAGCGYRLHGKRYQGIGMGLQGAGIVTLYFVGFASYSIYHLLPGWVAFGALALVTGLAATLAVRQNALLIAVIGSIGGYATPFLVHQEELEVSVFCGYLLLLGAGLTGVARFRDWKILHLIALFGTYLIYGIFGHSSNIGQYPWQITFLSAYFVLFSWQSILYNLGHRQKITLFEVLVLVANFFFYLVLAIELTRGCYGSRMATWVPLGTTVFFAAQTVLFLKWKIQDRILLMTLLVLSALSLGLVFPLAFTGKWITTAWSLQALAMLFLAIRIRSNVLRGLAMVLYFIAGFRILSMDLQPGFLHANLHYWEGMRERLFSLGSFTISLLAGAWLLNQSAKAYLRPGALAAAEGNDFSTGRELSDRQSANAFLWIGMFLAFVYLFSEASRFGKEFFAPLAPWVHGYLIVGFLGFLVWRQKRAQEEEHRRIILGVTLVLAFFAVGYLISVQVTQFFFTRYFVGYGVYRLLEFVPVCGLLVFYGWLFREERRPRVVAGVFTVIGLGLWFLYSSLELFRAMQVELPNFRNGAVSVLWGIYAVILLWVGVKRHITAFRMTGLVLFGVTAFKIFLVDLARLETLYRIIAFVLLGVSMLVGAFLYMRFRDSFTSEEKK